MRSGLLLLLLCAAAFGEVTEIRDCRFHEGDNPAWARPDTDDHDWLRAAPEPPRSPYLWARCSVTIPQPVNEPLYIQWDNPAAGAWILYVNGARTASQGDPETGRFAMDMFRETVLPPHAGTEPIKLAVRYARRRPVFPGVPLGVVGSKAELTVRVYRDFVQNTIPLGLAIVQLGVAVVLLTLSFSGRSHRGTILLGILALVNPLDNFLVLFLLVGIPVPLDLAHTVSVLARAGAIVVPFFAYSILGRKTPRFFRYAAAGVLALHLGQFVVILAPLSVALPWSVRFNDVPRMVANGVWTVYLGGLVTALFPWHTLRRQERWLLIPNALLFSSAAFLNCALTFARAYAGVGTAALSLVSVLFDVFYAVLIALRFRRVDNEHRSLTDEMSAAREMQRRLVPEVGTIDGFRIDTAYIPAKEVGGDFFRVLPAENGAVLVVVGDVSGKGLPAAMTVAAIAGALDNEDSRSPAEVLTRLNRALRSRKGEGFVTCCAALVERSGEVVIANAGHLPPYAGGVELPVEAELPLGVVDGVIYSATRLRLRPGETLTFVSDGVVEAKDAKEELFGFERTRAISSQGPEAIARVAREFGQDDDITVVSIGLTEAGA